MLPKTVISSAQILTRRSQSALGFGTASWAAHNGHLHILEYLVERKYDKFDEVCVCVCSRVRPLELFEVLARNRQMALGLSGRSIRAQEQPHRLCTIPPRQQLSITRRLVVRRWTAARSIVIIISIIIIIIIISCTNRKKQNSLLCSFLFFWVPTIRKHHFSSWCRHFIILLLRRRI